ncbi:MAG: hypothetical protein ACLP8S_04435 [Solirubrobacteraceae bacterium]
MSEPVSGLTGGEEEHMFAAMAPLSFDRRSTSADVGVVDPMGDDFPERPECVAGEVGDLTRSPSSSPT